VLYTTGQGITDKHASNVRRANGFVAKPYIAAELCTAIDNLLRYARAGS
jgi:hypothetical protein